MEAIKFFQYPTLVLEHWSILGLYNVYQWLTPYFAKNVSFLNKHLKSAEFLKHNHNGDGLKAA